MISISSSKTATVEPPPISTEKRMKGSIRKIKQDRGFGFIAGDDGRDHFFHWSGFDKSSKGFKDAEVQDRVSFLSIEGEKGPRAVEIRVE